jgi:leucyl aminopeptidase
MGSCRRRPALLRIYSFDNYQRAASGVQLAVQEIAFRCVSKSDVEVARIVTEATSLARDLTNMPAVELTPEGYASIAQEQASRPVNGHLEASVFGQGTSPTARSGCPRRRSLVLPAQDR